jgi:heptaprenyl diphosphate synthase
MLAVIVVLTAAEHLLPPLPLLPPGVKLGLSNIVTMYCVFYVGRGSAVTLNILKSLFVLLTRGALAGALSLSGGLLSIGAVILLVFLWKEKASYAAVSVVGACAHNLGQYTAVSVVLRANYLTAYLPVLLISGLVMGLATGTLLKATLPALRRMNPPAP